MTQLGSPLPGELTYNKYDNPYGESARDSLFAEFGLRRLDAQKFKLYSESGFVHLYGIEKSYHQLGQYDGRDKHRVSYIRGKFIPDKMTFSKEQYRPGRSKRHGDLLSRFVFYPSVKAHVVFLNNQNHCLKRGKSLHYEAPTGLHNMVLNT